MQSREQLDGAKSAHRLSGAGAVVTEVSVPLHRDGAHIWNAIAVEGATIGVTFTC